MIETDVLVVGAGPCGITLGNLLGTYGIDTIVVDRDTAIVEFPRAVGIDDESLRSYQAAELADPIMKDIVQNTAIRYYTSWGRMIAHVRPSAQPFGWPRRNLFLQPLFEAELRKGIDRFEGVQLKLGTEAVGLAQDRDGVTATIRTADGGEELIRAKFVVAADGGKSPLRKILGIELTGSTAPERWLVVDVDEDQLDQPYSAVHCDADQPILTIPLPYRHRRWEFKLQQDDTPEDIVREERVAKLLRPMYGTTPLPNILSSRVYFHHSRIARTFQRGRVFIAGDAAHLQPPFFGQGMNSGIRDATNLAWKLAAVVKGQANKSLLDTYDSERRITAKEMVSFATTIGSYYSPKSLLTEKLRDVFLRGAMRIPGGKEYILQMKFKPMPKYENGLVAGAGTKRSKTPVGRMFPQPLVEEQDGTARKLDDVIGPWFGIIGVQADPRAHLSEKTRKYWEELGARFIRVDYPRAGSIDKRDEEPSKIPGLTVVEDLGGAFREMVLASQGTEFFVIRPDRYLAAAAGAGDLDARLTELQSLMGQQLASV